MSRVVFCEPFCGTAAVTLRLLGGLDAHSPVTYMGAKRRYAAAILAAMGLRSGQGADEVILADTGPWARAWSILTQPGGPGEVASCIANMKGDGAALFDELRHAGQPADPIKWVAAFLALQGSGAKGIPVRANPDGSWATNGYAHISKSGARRGFIERLRPHLLAARVARLSRVPWPSRVQVLATDARRLPPGALRATYLYADPPYLGTTGYGGDGVTEGELRSLCDGFAQSGALVAISEGRALDWPGWHPVNLTTCGKRGQVRTFTKSREEHLLLSSPPASVPPVQLEFFSEGHSP